MAERPDAGIKYHTSQTEGPVVADRPTLAVEVDEHGLLRERLYVDEESGLLLKREQFDAGGAVSRAVGFDTLVLDPATPPPPSPSSPADQAPKALSPDRLGAPGLAPDQLAGGYRRLGVYRRSGVVQVLYSDGMYDLSVFEQPGRLDRHSLAAGGSPVERRERRRLALHLARRPRRAVAGGRQGLHRGERRAPRPDRGCGDVVAGAGRGVAVDDGTAAEGGPGGDPAPGLVGP